MWIADPRLSDLLVKFNVLKLCRRILPHKFILHLMRYGNQQLPLLCNAKLNLNLPILRQRILSRSQLHLQPLQLKFAILQRMLWFINLQILHQRLSCRTQRHLPALLVHATFLHLLCWLQMQTMSNRLSSKPLWRLPQLRFISNRLFLLSIHSEQLNRSVIVELHNLPLNIFTFRPRNKLH